VDERKFLWCSQDMKRAEREGKEDLSQFTCPNPACAYHRTHDL